MLMGLGASKPSIIYAQIGGGATDCSVFSEYVTNAQCWKYTPGAWDQMNQFGTPPSSVFKPPPAPDSALSTAPGGPYACSDGSMVTAATNCPEYSAALDAALAQGKILTNAALLDWYGTQAPVDEPPTSPGVNWLLYGGLGLAFVLVLVAAK